MKKPFVNPFKYLLMDESFTELSYRNYFYNSYYDAYAIGEML